jgi:hypothetical protein
MNNNDWQLQQQLHQQQQQQFFWDCCILANQWQTNKELQRLGELQQQNNALLEQIRRMQLTPAQRAAEDQQRARLKILHAAEAQLAREREHTAYFLILCFLTMVIGFIAIGSALQAHPAVQAIPAQVQTTATPKPDYAPRAELVRLPSNP